MKIKFSHLFLLFIFFYFFDAHPQKIQLSGEVSLQGLYSEEELPFWMYSNTRGRIFEETNLAGWISGKAFYNLGQAGSLEAGGGILFRDNDSDNFLLDELYGTYTFKWLDITIGRKQHKELYNGLSASNESILWSLNARPLPGVQIGTNRPVFLFSDSGLGFEGAWNEYQMEKNRFMSKARIHHKNFRMVYRSDDVELKAGIQHFVQWGGTTPAGVRQPDGFKDYIRVISGWSGSENANQGDQLNALGNHLGGYEFYFTRFFEKYNIEFIYNHLFDDKSGMRLGNTPDGRYGLFLNLHNKQQWVNGFIYELYYTKHQSSTTSGNHIWDNYLNNFLYQSGWTYENKTIGSPFFVPNVYDEPYGHGYTRIGSNKFVAHHVGISGYAFQKFPYKVLSSYRTNYGHYRIAGDFISEYYPPNDPRGKKSIPPQVISTFLGVKIPSSIVDFNILLGADFTSERTNLGFGLNIQKRF